VLLYGVIINIAYYNIIYVITYQHSGPKKNVAYTYFCFIAKINQWNENLRKFSRSNTDYSRLKIILVIGQIFFANNNIR